MSEISFDLSNQSVIVFLVTKYGNWADWIILSSLRGEVEVLEQVGVTEVWNGVKEMFCMNNKNFMPLNLMPYMCNVASLIPMHTPTPRTCT